MISGLRPFREPWAENMRVDASEIVASGIGLGRFRVARHYKLPRNIEVPRNDRLRSQNRSVKRIK